MSVEETEVPAKKRPGPKPDPMTAKLRELAKARKRYEVVSKRLEKAEPLIAEREQLQADISALKAEIADWLA